jgi:23S rRNA (adenine2030-N6)-methyltransferase
VNYRHAYHAGNFADCMKHALLIWLLRALAVKPAPFTVLDTHAGAGRYNLAEDSPAGRTGEWRAGIGLLMDHPPAAVADYVAVVKQEGLYPGSPAIIRSLLREQDRLICCELHPEDAVSLRREFGRDSQVAVHARDGWAALSALLPPVQKRGLVLIDPPYEQGGEHDRLVAAFRTVAARFPAAIVAGWYPIKHLSPVRTLLEGLRLSGVRDVVTAEIWLRDPTDPTRLNGCGLLVRHPPWHWDTEWPPILDALLLRLGGGEAGEGVRAVRVTDE